jgi:hypothetical protein
MTVMLESFFGMHQQIVRSGLWRHMKPGEKDLYVYLMYKSERYRNRELTCTDREITEAVGTASRTLCNARKKLIEQGLIKCERSAGGKYRYVICDPRTNLPYPGASNQIPIRSKSPHFTTAAPEKTAETKLPEVRGLPGVFDN